MDGLVQQCMAFSTLATPKAVEKSNEKGALLEESVGFGTLGTGERKSK